MARVKQPAAHLDLLPAVREAPSATAEGPAVHAMASYLLLLLPLPLPPLLLPLPLRSSQILPRDVLLRTRCFNHSDLLPRCHARGVSLTVG